MKLTDATWIIPLLEAHLRGETIQYNNPYDDRWGDITQGHYDFIHKERYRIKPKEPEYRLYSYCHSPGFYCVERNTLTRSAANYLKSVEKQVVEGKAEWLTDWLPLPIKRYD